MDSTATLPQGSATAPRSRKRLQEDMSGIKPEQWSKGAPSSNANIKVNIVDGPSTSSKSAAEMTTVSRKLTRHSPTRRHLWISGPCRRPLNLHWSRFQPKYQTHYRPPDMFIWPTNGQSCPCLLAGSLKPISRMNGHTTYYRFGSRCQSQNNVQVTRHIPRM